MFLVPKLGILHAFSRLPLYMQSQSRCAPPCVRLCARTNAIKTKVPKPFTSAARSLILLMLKNVQLESLSYAHNRLRVFLTFSISFSLATFSHFLPKTFSKIFILKIYFPLATFLHFIPKTFSNFFSFRNVTAQFFAKLPICNALFVLLRFTHLFLKRDILILSKTRYTFLKPFSYVFSRAFVFFKNASTTVFETKCHYETNGLRNQSVDQMAKRFKTIRQGPAVIHFYGIRCPSNGTLATWTMA